MEHILFVNACVRPESRTRILAQSVLNKLGGRVTEVNLEREGLTPLNLQTMMLREKLASTGDFSDPMFRYGKQFAEADTIVIAAPYWDLSFPASVKTYLEAITVLGLTFHYTPEGIPEGLCRAKRLIYVQTAGGPILENDHGFLYIRDLAQKFYGIEKVLCFQAENLDIQGADVEGILERAKANCIKALCCE